MRIGTILIRELQVLSRRVSGYWLRVVFLGLAFLAWSIPYILIPNDGVSILYLVTIVSMVIFGLSAGLSVSDTISSERRLETLGLLMLTPLRPVEILFGKLMTGVTHFLLCLFAITPFLAIPLLSGGVTWADVLRCCLAIWAMTFLGLSVGLFWTVVFRELKNSSTATVITLLGVHLIPSLPLLILLELFNVPLYYYADDFLFPIVNIIDHTIGATFDSSRYFYSIAVLIGTGTGFIIAAYFSFRLVWRWETNPQSAAPNPQSTALDNKSTKIELNRNRQLVIIDTENPYQKLIAAFHPKQFWLRGIINLIFIFTMIGFLLLLSDNSLRSNYGGISVAFFLMLELVVRWTVAVETPQQIIHDRKTGFIELLMVSPLSDKSIVSGLITNLRQFQFNRSLFLCIHCFSLYLLIIHNERYRLSWSTNTLMFDFVSFIGAIFWIYLGLRLEIKESNTKRFLLMIIAQALLFGAYFLIFVNFNSSSSLFYSLEFQRLKIYFTDFERLKIIFLFLTGIIFLSFFSLRVELKKLNTIKFEFLMTGHLLIILNLVIDYLDYSYKYPFGHSIILLAFIGGSLYTTYCLLQSNRNNLQPKRIVLLMIAQLSIAGGFYYLMAIALSFNDRHLTSVYFWVTCGTIILLFWGFRSRANRLQSIRFKIFAIGCLCIFCMLLLLIFDWQFNSRRVGFIIYSCCLAGIFFLSFYELHVIRFFGLYLAARNLTHLKIILILFTINFILPLFLFVLIASVVLLIDIRFLSSLFDIKSDYVVAGMVFSWLLVRVVIAMVLYKFSFKQLLEFRQINV